MTQEQDSDFGYGDRFGLRSNYQKLYSWLLLLEDGNQIDLGVETVEHMQQGCTRNKLFLPLLDKIGCLPKLPPPSDEDGFFQYLAFIQRTLTHAKPGGKLSSPV